MRLDLSERTPSENFRRLGRESRSCYKTVKELRFQCNSKLHSKVFPFYKLERGLLGGFKIIKCSCFKDIKNK